MTIVRATAGSPIPAAADASTFRGVEQWCSRELLRVCGVDVLAGVTDELERKERLRRAIVDHQMQAHYAGNARDGGERMTWRRVFERLYGEQL